MPHDNSYILRPFLAEEVSLYKAMRLEALQNHPEMFGSSYAREMAFTDEQWMARISSLNSACLGLFHSGELIGITGIVMDRERPGMAEMVQSYICRPYRGMGLSSLFYKERLKWAQAHGIKRIIIGHRDGNDAVKAECLKHGFIHTHTESRIWPDGSAANTLYYELNL